ncbi:hypothetical protein MJO28_014779 [Puccinia striiformis f. sp. tritici]|uniref:Uncharacterized protein n=1 Tax=Puccinia striiformis f. sp. tritici TaxID=168172 RepID=A0ACC0DUF1_9BASI|nr:hypothetical protein MJO28_014779 [Puccinia striiformis f. sp. tritici]
MCSFAPLYHPVTQRTYTVEEGSRLPLMGYFAFLISGDVCGMEEQDEAMKRRTKRKNPEILNEWIQMENQQISKLRSNSNSKTQDLIEEASILE